MSFGVSRGKRPDTSTVEVTADELSPLPDEILHDPTAGFVDLRSWFTDPSLPLEIEIGSGKGTFLVQQASEQTDTNFLGIEYAREFFAYAADRVRRHGLANVRMLCTDAGEFLRWRTPHACARVVHLYFPDPWPKTRHHKKRMVQDGFLRECHRVLQPGGELRVVTDHPDYWAWMQDHFNRWTSPEGVGGLRFDRLDFTRPESAGEGEVVGTNFERKYRREGRPFHACVLRRPG